MKLADCSVQTNKLGSTVAVYGVSPLEAVILTAEHHNNVGKPPIKEFLNVREVEREDITEVNRLNDRYGSDKVQAALRGLLHKIPEDFASAAAVGVQVKLPSKRMMDFHV